MSEKKTADGGTRMTTFTGKYVDPNNMDTLEIDIEDIAQGLSNMCRFAGQTREFYSVAQHSVLCAYAVLSATKDKNLARIALLHDAPEAYLGDLVRAVKAHLSDYQDMEYGLWCSVVLYFELQPLAQLVMEGDEAEMPLEVKDADLRMLVTERRDLIVEQEYLWDLQITHKPYGFEIKPMLPAMARRFFMNAYLDLFKK